MGNCFCCLLCREDTDTAVSISSPPRDRPTLATGGTSLCDVCGCVFDHVLLTGHRETCRVNHRRAMYRPTMMSTDKQGINDSDDSVVTCVVCLAAPRAFAFLPCGHVSCCKECARLMSVCPICRGGIRGTCIVEANALLRFKCPHCDAIITPELYEGHREVCAIRKHQEGTKPDGDAAIGGDIELMRCVACRGTGALLIITLPCGHRVMCEECTKSRTTCPICLQDITGSIKSYL